MTEEMYYDDLEDSSSSEENVNKTTAQKAKELRQVTNSVDRDEEDNLIREYQKTKDEDILSELLALRTPTLSFWTDKYSYLSSSKEDLFSEFQRVWYKCVTRYEYEAKDRVVKDKFGRLELDENGITKTRKKKTNFNTFLFSSLLYHVRNKVKKKYSKKRTDLNGIPFQHNIVSIDEDMGNDSDGSFTLHDILESSNVHAHQKMSADEIIEFISEGDQEVAEALRLLAFEPNIKRLSVAAKTKYGNVPLEKSARDKLIKGNKSAVNTLKKMIQKNDNIDGDFQIVSYQVYTNRVQYEIRVKDTRLQKKIMKIIASKKKRFEHMRA